MVEQNRVSRERESESEGGKTTGKRERERGKNGRK